MSVTAVRAGFALDEARLVPWLEEHVPDFAAPVTIKQFSGGQSNPTYRLTTRRAAARRVRGGARGAGDAGARRGGVAGAAHPRAVHRRCRPRLVVLRHRLWRGAHLLGRRPARLPRDQRTRYQLAAAETLGALHHFDPAALGLSDYGRPDRRLERQLARWTRQYVEDDAAPHGIKGRIARGTAGAEAMIAHLDMLARHGQEVAERMVAGARRMETTA